jgi:hypothetical protein
VHRFFFTESNAQGNVSLYSSTYEQLQCCGCRVAVADANQRTNHLSHAMQSHGLWSFVVVKVVFFEIFYSRTFMCKILIFATIDRTTLTALMRTLTFWSVFFLDCRTNPWLHNANPNFVAYQNQKSVLLQSSFSLMHCFDTTNKTQSYG